MIKPRLTASALFLSAAALLGSSAGKTVTWNGYVTDTWCGVNRDTKAPTVECTNECVQSNRAKYAFYNFADGKVYLLNPQAEAAKYAGKQVVGSGTGGGGSGDMKT